MSFPRTIRNFNAFMDGLSFFGVVTTGKLPALSLKTEAHRGAGMDGEIGQDMGLEAMSAELTFKEYTETPIRKFGTQNRIVLRPAAMGEDDTDADAWVFTMGGLITSVNWGDLEAGKASMLTATMDVRLFQAEKNGVPLFKIDVANGVRVIDGIDQLASMRRAMGI